MIVLPKSIYLITGWYVLSTQNYIASNNHSYYQMMRSVYNNIFFVSLQYGTFSSFKTEMLPIMML